MNSQPASTTPTASQIPDLVRIGSVSTDTAINVQTDILDPVIFSESECRFVLDNKGILHSNSRVTFSTAGDTKVARTGRTFFPAGVGIHALIQRASLRVGTKTICEIEDFNFYSAYETNFLPPDAIKEREQVMTGRMMSVAPSLQDRGFPFINASKTGSLTESLTEAKSIQVDNGKDPTSVAIGTEIAFPIVRTATPTPNRVIWDYQNEMNSPTYSILLADLFPFLKMNQLPLYMMSEQVSIHLTFAPQASLPGDEVRVTTTDGFGLNNPVTLSRSDCQLIADYIYYPQDMMEQYRQENSTMTFSYVDYQFVKRTVQDTEYSTGLIQNLGGAGRVVNKVFTGTQIRDDGYQSLLQQYVAEGPITGALSVGQVTTNLKYNDTFLYPIDVTNNARHFHNVFSAEGRVPHISRDLYRGEGQLTTTQTALPGSIDFEGYSGEDGLESNFFYTAYRLNSGERVNSRGIELYDTRVTMADAGTMRAWLQVVKIATLRDGIFTMAFA